MDDYKKIKEVFLKAKCWNSMENVLNNRDGFPFSLDKDFFIDEYAKEILQNEGFSETQINDLFKRLRERKEITQIETVGISITPFVAETPLIRWFYESRLLKPGDEQPDELERN